MNATQSQPSEEKVVIILANRPRFLREIMQRVLRKIPQTHFVFEFEDGEDLPALLNVIHAQWLVVTLETDDGVPITVETAMREHPNLNVMAVSPDSERLRIFRSANRDQTEQIPLEDLSLSQLVELLNPAS